VEFDDRRIADGVEDAVVDHGSLHGNRRENGVGDDAPTQVKLSSATVDRGQQIGMHR